MSTVNNAQEPTVQTKLNWRGWGQEQQADYSGGGVGHDSKRLGTTDLEDGKEHCFLQPQMDIQHSSHSLIVLLNARTL